LTISTRSTSSRRRVPVILSQIAFARGACGGLARIRTPSAWTNGVQGTGELVGAVPDQERDGSHAGAEIHQEVAGRLRCLRAVRGSR
jgi:hypothetical protein